MISCGLPPPSLSPLDLKWTTQLHPSLAYSKLPIVNSSPKKAPKNYLSIARARYGEKYVDYPYLSTINCKKCKKIGHKTGQCDTLPTLRKLRTPIQEIYLKFQFSLKPVIWEQQTGPLEEIAYSLPSVFRKLKSLISFFWERWYSLLSRINQPARNPWDPVDTWSFPQTSRKGVPAMYAMGYTAEVRSKIIAGDYTRFVRTPERLQFPNHPSCVSNKVFLDKKIKELLEVGAIYPVPRNWARRILPLKVVHSSHFIPSVPFSLPTMESDFRHYVDHNWKRKKKKALEKGKESGGISFAGRSSRGRAPSPITYDNRA